MVWSHHGSSEAFSQRFIASEVSWGYFMRTLGVVVSLTEFASCLHDLCRLLQGVRQLFVCVIWLVLFSVPSLGFSCVLPRLFTGPALFLNIAWAATLAMNIFFNFGAAILRHPGVCHFHAQRCHHTLEHVYGQ